MYDDRLDPHFAAGALYPQGNFAAVRYQDFLKHGLFSRQSVRSRTASAVAALSDDEQRLAVLHRLPVLDKNFLDDAVAISLNLVQ